MKRLTDDHSNKDRSIIAETPIQSPKGSHLCDELREAEDGPVVEDWVVEDIGHHPGKGAEGALSRRLLPAELQAGAGVVQAANGQCELQQVVLIFRLVPPSLQSHKETTTLSGKEGRHPVSQEGDLFHGPSSCPIQGVENH